MKRMPIYEVTACHYDARGDEHCVAHFSAANASRRLCRVAAKQIARKSGLSYSLVGIDMPSPGARNGRITANTFRRLAGARIR